MSLIAIISDIHGNLEALTKVLKYCDHQKIDELYCLGDVVGYGPNPNECVEIIEETANVKIVGNHDLAMMKSEELAYFNKYALIAAEWTKKELTDENLEKISRYEDKRSVRDIIYVHSSPRDPLLWGYVKSHDDALEELNRLKEHICFIGHSHIPVTFTLQEMAKDTELVITQSEKYIINIGSVGQPRDGNPKASFGLYNTNSKRYINVRLTYNFKKTMEKIYSKPVPEFLGLRLALGL